MIQFLRGLNGYAASAFGETTTSPPATTRVLVLPVHLGGVIFDEKKYREIYDARVFDGLLTRGWETVTPTGLSANDLACTDPTCLTRIAAQMKVGYVAGSLVELDNKKPPAWHVKVWIFRPDVERSGQAPRHPPGTGISPPSLQQLGDWVEKEDVCSRCGEE